jgi:hypothetical protein
MTRNSRVLFPAAHDVSLPRFPAGGVVRQAQSSAREQPLFRCRRRLVHDVHSTMTSELAHRRHAAPTEERDDAR